MRTMTILALSAAAIALCACSTVTVRSLQMRAESAYQIGANGATALCISIQKPKVQAACAKARNADATVIWPGLETSLSIAKGTTVKEGDPADIELDAAHTLSGAAHVGFQATAPVP